MTDRRALMVLGTSPRSAKSVVTIALCRALADRGHKVSPFKALSVIQAAADPRAGEAPGGHGLYHQCQAARIAFDTRMNPVVVRAEDPRAGHLFMDGQIASPVRLLNEDSVLTRNVSPHLRAAIVQRVQESYLALREEFDFLILEGAGSPVDLPPEDDIPNILIARLSNVPIIFSCKFSRGGGAAALVGTVHCLSAEIRRLVAGFTFSDAQSDDALEYSVRLVEDHLGIPYLGTVPRVPLWAPDIDTYELLARTICDHLDWRPLGWADVLGGRPKRDHRAPL